MHLSAVVVWLLPLVAGDIPIPPRQSEFQVQHFGEVNAKAKIASQAATAGLLTVFDSAEFRSRISECCPELAKLPADDILARYHAEIETIELVHNFHPEGGGISADNSLNTLSDAKYFYNLWQLAYLGLVNNSHLAPGGILDTAETTLFGCNTFSAKPTFDEVSDRLIYAAFSLSKADTGNPGFGPISVVFSPNYVRNMTLIAPTDTGIWEMDCNNTFPPWHGNPFPWFNCTAWDKTLGTFDHYDHLVLASVQTLINSSDGSMDLLAAEFGRMFAPAVTKLNLFQVFSYWEANIAGTVFLSDGVKYIIGSFPLLWGAAWGTSLREWCMQHQWVLVWALGPNGATMDDRYKGYDRLVDPVVLASTSASSNLTVSVDTLAKFASSWSNANSTRPHNGTAPDPTTAAEWWNELFNAAPRSLQVHPLQANQCADVNGCIGFNGDDKCICY